MPFRELPINCPRMAVHCGSVICPFLTWLCCAVLYLSGYSGYLRIARQPAKSCRSGFEIMQAEFAPLAYERIRNGICGATVELSFGLTTGGSIRLRFLMRPATSSGSFISSNNHCFRRRSGMQCTGPCARFGHENPCRPGSALASLVQAFLLRCQKQLDCTGWIRRWDKSRMSSSIEFIPAPHTVEAVATRCGVYFEA